MKTHLLVPPVALLTLSLVFAAPVRAETVLVVELNNRTPGHTTTAGATVKLVAGRGILKTQTTGEDGNTTFTIPDDQAGTPKRIVVVYREGRYSRGGIQTPEGKTSRVSIDVWETTEQRDEVKILDQRLLLMPNQQHPEHYIEVYEQVHVVNEGNRTYIGPARGTKRRAGFEFALPAGFLHFTPGGTTLLGDRLEQDQEGGVIYNLLTLPPGKTHYQFQYFLPVKDRHAIYQIRTRFQTSSFHVSLPGGLALEGDSLESIPQEELPPRLRELDGRAFRAGPLQPGTTLQAQLHVTQSGPIAGDRPRPSDPATEPSPVEEDQHAFILWVPVLLFGGFVAILSFFFATRGGVTARDRAALLHDHLIEEIARLDVDREKGSVSEAYHTEARNRLKEKLLDLERRSTR